MTNFFTLSGALIIASSMMVSCGHNSTKQKEVEPKEMDTELVSKENDTNDLKPIPTNEVSEVGFTSHTPCSFSVSLPLHFNLQPMEEEDNLDYCDYTVKTKDGFEIIELHSLISSRFDMSSIKELYQAAINESKLDISYKIQKGNWFVISGTNKENGNIVYWKRVSGNHFISDLHIEYPKSRESEIAPYISPISNSFTSE